MHPRSFVARYALFAAAFVFAFGLQAYLLVQSVLSKPSAGTKLTKADDCEDSATTPAAPQENPNKLLFISCGGFEE